MNLSDDLLVVRAIAPYTACRAVEGRLSVVTQCLYPGGDSVLVVVSAAAGGHRVSDDGGGWRALLDAGIEPAPSSHGKRARSIAQTMGLEYVRGAFVADEVSEAQLGAAIVIVANASQKWVSEVLGERQQRAERHFRRRVSDALEELFAESKINRQVQLNGATSKTYEFANIVTLRDRRVIVEPVFNHAGAIAASFLKLVDVHNAHPELAREVVIEDEDEWTSENLSVLSQASEGVRDFAKGLELLRDKYLAAA
jgi:hypothetical protein